MKFHPLTFLGVLALGLGSLTLRAEPAAPPAPADASATQALTRSSALELAGAFSNDGYKIRDGFWYAPVETGHDPILAVNLFAGNEYWFCAAAAPPATKIAITVYNEAGEIVDQQNFADGARFAAGVEPDASGTYFVKVSLLEGAKSQFCLVYCYK